MYLNLVKEKYLQLAGIELTLPERIVYDGVVFVKKEEFHITVTGAERSADLIDGAKIDDYKKKIIDFTKKYFSGKKINYKILDDIRLVSVGKNKTIVVMVECNDIVEFFDNLNAEFNSKIPLQPTHITLYTLPEDTFGIPISSHKELEKITKKINIEELEKIIQNK